MAIKGKKSYKVYLDEKNAEFVKYYLKSKAHEGGFSLLVDKYIEQTKNVIKKDLLSSEPTFQKEYSTKEILTIYKDSLKEEL